VIERARAAGVELSAGICFDTCGFGDSDADGAAVARAPLVVAEAGAGEILVTDTARPLLAGAYKLAARGELPGAGLALHAVRSDG
jgi:class 3 adenylate cyclase